MICLHLDPFSETEDILTVKTLKTLRGENESNLLVLEFSVAIDETGRSDDNKEE